MADESLYEEIRSLLAAPRSGTGAPGRARIEHTLTSGYARALALEAEKDRIERSGDGDEVETRLNDTTAELSSLRSLLEPLRARASELRSEESEAARSPAR